MTNEEIEQTHNNSEEIYKYTEKEIETINKNIDSIGSKLTSTLAFSGVLLKFVVDGKTSGKYDALIIEIESFFLFAAIICCALGLFAKETGRTIKSKSLDDDWYYFASKEDYRFRIVRQWHEVIDALDKLLSYRRIFLNTAIGLLVFVALLFASSNIISINFP